MLLQKSAAGSFNLYMEMAPYLTLGLLFVGLLSVTVNRQILIKYTGVENLRSMFIASGLGVPLPLCSCGVMPTAVYMAQNGASRGAVISFLISTPQTGIDSIIASWGMLGPFFSVFRPLAAFFMGITGGSFVSYFSRQQINGKISARENIAADIQENSVIQKIRKAFNYAFSEFLDDIAVNFIIGIFISAIIYLLIPDDYFAGLGITSGLPGMLIMILVGLPMYVCATGSIPIALILMTKGFSPGAAFVFLTVGPVTNAASIAVLFKALGKKTTVLYILAVTVLAVFSGLLFDLLYNFFGIPAKDLHIHNSGNSILQKLAALFLGICLAASLLRKFIFPVFFRKKLSGSGEKTITVFISGMTCNHCLRNVEQAIKSVPGVEDVKADLSSASACIRGENVDRNALAEKIRAAGYSLAVNR